MTALVANLPGLNVKSSTELRQSLPTVRNKHGDHSRRLADSKSPLELDFSSDGVSNGYYKSRNRQKHQGFHLARSTASLDCSNTTMQSQMQRRKSPRIEFAMEHLHKGRKNAPHLQSLDFDSEPTYYRLQVNFPPCLIINNHSERKEIRTLGEYIKKYIVSIHI